MMTREVLDTALPRLRRSLGLGEAGGDTDELAFFLAGAEEDILRYLNREALPECTAHLLVELAALKYQRARSAAGLKKSESYSEGQISQSESYLSPGELRAGETALLQSLAPCRRVGCKGVQA